MKQSKKSKLDFKSYMMQAVKAHYAEALQETIHYYEVYGHGCGPRWADCMQGE